MFSNLNPILNALIFKSMQLWLGIIIYTIYQIFCRHCFLCQYGRDERRPALFILEVDVGFVLQQDLQTWSGYLTALSGHGLFLDVGEEVNGRLQTICFLGLYIDVSFTHFQ